MQSEPVSPPPMTTHMLAGGEDRLVGRSGSLADAAVLLRQELHGEMHAAEVAARDRQVARLLGAARQHHGVVAVAASSAAGSRCRHGRRSGR